MRNQSSRFQNATVAGGNSETLCIKKKSAILNFLFLAPSQHNSLTSFVKFSFDFLLFFLFLPRTDDHAVVIVIVAIVVDEEKTFNWGEKRENWKNYNDKGTLGVEVKERVQGRQW